MILSENLATALSRFAFDCECTSYSLMLNSQHLFFFSALKKKYLADLADAGNW
jgi:hypothetical protein